MVWVVHICIVFSLFSPIDQTKDGFMNYAWGTPFAQMARYFTLQQTRSHDDQQQYSVDLESLGEAELEECEFEFVDKSFAGVIITTANRANSHRLLAFLKHLYGNGHVQDPMTIQWFSGDTHVSYDEGLSGNAYVYMYSRRLHTLKEPHNK